MCIVVIEMYILFSISLAHSKLYLKNEVIMRLSMGGAKRTELYVLVSIIRVYRLFSDFSPSHEYDV